MTDVLAEEATWYSWEKSAQRLDWQVREATSHWKFPVKVVLAEVAAWQSRWKNQHKAGTCNCAKPPPIGNSQ
jgi:hypothetical protein